MPEFAIVTPEVDYFTRQRRRRLSRFRDIHVPTTTEKAAVDRANREGLCRVGLVRRVKTHAGAQPITDVAGLKAPELSGSASLSIFRAHKKRWRCQLVGQSLEVQVSVTVEAVATSGAKLQCATSIGTDAKGKLSTPFLQSPLRKGSADPR